MSAPKGIPASDVLLRVLSEQYHLTTTLAGEPFAVRYDSPCVMIPLRGTEGLRQRLARDGFMVTGRAMNQQALADAMTMAEGMAMTPGKKRGRPALRVARAPDGAIIIDLSRDDGLMVWVTPAGWGTTVRPPVLFRRTPAMAALPVPVQRGNMAKMGGLVNLHSINEMALYAGCRLMSALPEGTRPVEILTGQPGAAKTTTTRITVEWLGGTMSPMPKDARDWAAIAAATRVLGHDNISHLTADRQDLMCKAASGHEHLGRALYTDVDLFKVAFEPLTLVVNGVEVGDLRGDLIRRSVPHRLDRPGRYTGDAEIAAQWEAAHGDALGWLLDLLVRVLRQMERTARPGADSLPGFAHVLASLDSLWGTGALALWRDSQHELYEEAADADPVALALRKGITAPWEGTAAQLLDLLDSQVLLPPSPSPGRPWTPRGLAAKLDRAQAALEALGWKVERIADSHAKARRIRLIPT